MSIQAIGTSVAPQGSPDARAVMHEIRGAVAPQVSKKTPAEQSKSPVEIGQLNAAVQSVREYIEPINANLEFSVNEETDQVVIKVFDSATKELIRQIPSEEMIAIAKALDSIKGLFIKQKA